MNIDAAIDKAIDNHQSSDQGLLSLTKKQQLEYDLYMILVD